MKIKLFLYRLILDIKEVLCKASENLAKLQGLIILFLIYYFFITPLGLLLKLIRRKKQFQDSYWQTVIFNQKIRRDYYKQY